MTRSWISTHIFSIDISTCELRTDRTLSTICGSHPMPAADLSMNDTSLGAVAMFANTVQPPSRIRKKKAPTLRENDWEPFRERIVDLYSSGMPLKQVKQAMETEFKFCAEYVSDVRREESFELAKRSVRVRQYKSCINRWKVDKNVKPSEMKAIVKKRQKRRLIETEKPELMFYVRGNNVEPAKIDRWMARHDVPASLLYSPSLAACELVQKR